MLKRTWSVKYSGHQHETINKDQKKKKDLDLPVSAVYNMMSGVSMSSVGTRVFQVSSLKSLLSYAQ